MASAIVYAEKGGEAPSTMVWPAWSADRPKSSEWIDKNRPICTVLARGSTKAHAKGLIRERIYKILAGFQGVSRGKEGEPKRKNSPQRAKRDGRASTPRRRRSSKLIDDADVLRVDVTRGTLGECRIDCGVRAVGGLKPDAASRRFVLAALAAWRSRRSIPTDRGRSW